MLNRAKVISSSYILPVLLISSWMSTGCNDVPYCSVSIFSGLNYSESFSYFKVHHLFKYTDLPLHFFRIFLFKVPDKQGCDFLHNYTIRLHFLQMYIPNKSFVPYFGFCEHRGMWGVIFFFCLRNEYAVFSNHVPSLLYAFLNWYHHTSPCAHCLVKVHSPLKYLKKTNIS